MQYEREKSNFVIEKQEVKGLSRPISCLEEKATESEKRFSIILKKTIQSK
jgi:hypothetical protein